MRFTCILLLTISFNALGQGVDKLVKHSPDKKFRLAVTRKEIGDSNTECNYWLIRTAGDSILLTTSILHDMPAPVTYWDKSSTKLIYEEQTYDKQEIRIYDLMARKLVFQTKGFIWGHSMEYFDQKRGIVIFFRRSNPERSGSFELLTLNVDTFEIKLIRSVETSGDPYSGAPEILTMDREKREIILVFEAKDIMNPKMEKVKVGY
jgi:hypothetical protein